MHLYVLDGYAMLILIKEKIIFIIYYMHYSIIKKELYLTLNYNVKMEFN